MTQTAGTAPPAAAPRHFTIRYPDSWWKLDLDPGTRDAAIRRAVQAQAEGFQVERTMLDTMIRSARKTAREAHARGAVQAAGMIQFTDNAEALTATTIVMRVVTPEDHSSDLSELILPVALKNAKNPLGKGTSANTAEVIELPGIGSVGRVTHIEDVDYLGRGTVRTALMHTVVPVPNSRDFLVVSSSTPNLSLVDAFFDVFDAISGTVRFQP
ncbi:hypothetical protein [Streptomyces sp. NBC_01481]|uniref:hypothetical protein n=1 Tax=Streptomyces sp. NBC_01481 TaxID=2975869 RepID=UPI00224FD362|nr:hypothetical protein [Streptomyces sp. NBC_01481]MCX4585350.1 hypothetical protein [Streptomyces sp. NBC_01481]